MTASGTRFQSSGTISFSFTAGTGYPIGVAITGSFAYYYDTAVSYCILSTFELTSASLGTRHKPAK